MMTAAEIRARLDAAASKDRIDGARRFFKEPIDPRGVAAPDAKRIAAEAYREIKLWTAAQRNKLCTDLWKDGKLEDGPTATYIYRRFEKQCGEAEFRLFESWIEHYVSNWAQCDSIAPTLLAACIGNEPESMLRLTDWTGSKNRWKRRAAATALLREAKQGRNTEFILAIADTLFEDADEMVQKGVGWLLKETYPKKPRETVDFLLSRIDRVPRLVVRYAAEKMSKDDRALVMKRD
jgi:3-methyladenine DNA glycosylase AlkD